MHLWGNANACAERRSVVMSAIPATSMLEHLVPPRFDIWPVEAETHR